MTGGHSTVGTRPKTMAIGAALLLGFGLVLYAISPNITALNRFALTPTAKLPGAPMFEIDRTNERAPRALYIPAAGGVLGLALGSREIAIAGSHGASGFGLSSRSILASLPPVEDNATAWLSVRTGEDHGRIGMSRVYLAPAAIADDAARTQRQWAWRTQVASLIVGVIASFVVLSLIAGVAPHFSTGALGALAYLVLAQALARESDVGVYFAHLIDGAEYLLAVWVAFALAVVLKDGAGAPRFGRLSLFSLGLSSTAVFGPGLGATPVHLWAAAVLAAPLLAIGAMRTWRAAADPAFSPMAFAAMALGLAAAAFGLMRAADPRLFNEAFGLATLHHLGTLPLLTLGTALLSVHSFAARRETIAKLRADYAAQSVELGGVRASLQEEARKRMLFEERSRITRDMHDGIGGRLLSLLIRVRAGRLDITAVEREVQESLNDLRLIVDSLDSAGESLGGAFSAFRARAERQLDGAGIALDWPEDEGKLDDVTLEPQPMLDLFRILQETVSNAIGHSGAANVSVAIAREGDTLSIAIADDGRGLAPDAAANGHGKGLKNMKARAARLGADLSMGSNGGKGHRIAIALPLKRSGYSSLETSSQPS